MSLFCTATSWIINMNELSVKDSYTTNLGDLLDNNKEYMSHGHAYKSVVIINIDSCVGAMNNKAHRVDIKTY